MTDSINFRYRTLNKELYQGGNVLYWMSREQRVENNWSLVTAQYFADKYKRDLKVIFCLTENFLAAPWRHYHFMLEGLKQVSFRLESLNIKFNTILGYPPKILVEQIIRDNMGIIITDFDPLKIKQRWKAELLKIIKIPLVEVDGHNLIPPWILSDHQEYNAYFTRKKINQKLNQFLIEIPAVHKRSGKKIKNNNNWDKIYRNIKIDRSVSPVKNIKAGSEYGSYKASLFIQEKKLRNYQIKHNDPNEQAQSGLSPYIHFGQVSVQKLLLDLLSVPPDVSETWIEELLVRRELAENYCFYQENYDHFLGLPEWAQKTLEQHRPDKRPYIYSAEQLEDSQTHDRLWNASQQQMVVGGTMPGYLRMYWAKKILEWTPDPSRAIEIAIYLNNKYQLDGRDPSSYAGILWSIGGLHDRPWPERNIFGKIRYMNYRGCQRKFNVDKYIEFVDLHYPQ